MLRVNYAFNKSDRKTVLMEKQKQGNQLTRLLLAGNAGSDHCQRLQTTILEAIPLARAMQLQVVKVDNDSGLHLFAPLQPNSNHTGSAFGGAIGSLLILAGWGWMQLANESVGYSRDVVVQHTQGHSRWPCDDDLNVICPAPYDSDWQRYCKIYKKHGRARLKLQPQLIKADGSVASSLVAEYVSTDSSFHDTHV